MQIETQTQPYQLRRNVSEEQLRAICEILGVRPEDFSGESEITIRFTGLYEATKRR